MRGARKGREPEELRAWKERQINNEVQPEYRNLEHSVRRTMVQALYGEQTGQCVYCGRRITLDEINSYHVEHFRPRSKYRILELEYTNLFLSCSPEGGDGTGETCGDHKGNWFEEECHIAPAPESCANRFDFRASGEIVGDGSPEAITMIDVLNLNEIELVIERQRLIQNIDGDLNADVAAGEMVESYLHTGPQGWRPSFSNVAIRYLERVTNTQLNARHD